MGLDKDHWRRLENGECAVDRKELERELERLDAEVRRLEAQEAREQEQWVEEELSNWRSKYHYCRHKRRPKGASRLKGGSSY